MKRLRKCGPRHHERLFWLYVGVSSKPAHERYEQHLAGTKACKKRVTRFGRHLRPELYQGLPAVPWDNAEQLERDHAERLRDAGYCVYTNGTAIERRPASRLRPFSLEELTNEALGLRDAAAMSVAANPFRPVGPAMIAHVLWGSIDGPRLREWALHRLPEYGRFAHVRHIELIER
jgi:hypothetical protein